MIVRINTFKTVGIEPVGVLCECEITNGVGIHLVGLADSAVRESLLRTVTALQANGYHIPGKKTVINFAPADLRKNGLHFDLPIAVGIVTAAGEVSAPDLEDYLIAGELALDGSVRPISGCIQGVLEAKNKGLKGCIIPEANVEEVAAIFGENGPMPLEGTAIYPVKTLKEVISVLTGDEETIADVQKRMSLVIMKEKKSSSFDVSVLSEAVKRALEIAAAGGHHLLLVGAPGSGKTTIAAALRDILPPMTDEEKIENAKIRSVSYPIFLPTEERPLRAPHYSASLSAIIGGGAGDMLRPGEVSIANNGVLYLDEFNLFPKATTEALRAPLEDGKVTLLRLNSRIIFPSRFHLVAGMCPCPCGYYGVGERCTCTPAERSAFLAKASGPLMDHIAMQLYVYPTTTVMKKAEEDEDPLADIRERVAKARAVQAERFKEKDYNLNDDIPSRDIETVCHLSEECQELLVRIAVSLGLSARSYTRILRMARTIADLSESKDILPHHIAEASSYRFLDRNVISETV